MLDNKNIQKVFSLSDFRKKQLVGDVPQRTRETYREYGYFGCGNAPGIVSTVDRMDYSTDTSTTSTRNNLLSPSTQAGAAGNSNFGYFGGGSNSRSLIQRIDYSNETTSIRSNLNYGTSYGRMAIGNSNFAYWGGSYSPSPFTYRTQLERIEYSNDVSSPTLRGFLPTATRMGPGSLSRNNDFGYYASGLTTGPGVSATVARLPYANDTITMLYRGNLVVARREVGQGTGNSNFGYIAGTNGAPAGSNVDRINYANDLATASPRGNLNISVASISASGNSNFGYFGGGNPLTSAVQRIDYSNDTVLSSTRGPLSRARDAVTATSSSSFGGAPNSSFASNFTFPTVPNAGYFGGGFDGTNVFATIDKVDYANDTTTASVRSALSSARYALSATGNGNFGYFAGGRPTPSSPDTSTIDRIEYASDTQNAVTRSTLNNAVRLLASAGNSNFGYFSGGFPTRNGVDRLDYSTDTTATSPRQGLPLATYSLAATGNRNFGYFCGGLTASPTTNRSEIYRVDYSNDSTIPQNRGPLSEAKREGAATGNDNFGYFGGAVNPGLSPSVRSQIERIDYSNDTVITSVRSRLNTPLFATGATGNSNFGYFGAGTNGPANFSTVDRINYSNDTASLSIRGPLSTGKGNLAATSPLAYGGAPIYFTNTLPEVLQKQIEFNDSNTLDLPFKRALGSYGYFGGGYTIFPNPGVSNIRRIDYSNDTISMTPVGLLSSPRYLLAATGNSNFGYFGGGLPVPSLSTIDRVDYSNDSATALVRGPLSAAKYSHGATGNSNFGWFGSNRNNSSVDRVDYSNDLVQAVKRINFTTNDTANATGNNNHGYFIVGGFGESSTIRRINYSNDTTAYSIRGNLSLARNSMGATGNSNFGYFGGGRIPGPITLNTVDRINYSNDTTAALVRGSLSLTRGNLAATGNSNFGYFGGGITFPGSVLVSTVDRVDYSNDTQTASARGPFNNLRGMGASTNARNS